MFLIILVLDDHVCRVPSQEPHEQMSARVCRVEHVREEEERILDIIEADLDSIFVRRSSSI